MTIHFICRGNTFRSRLAEAYLRSLEIKGIRVKSSGTVAARTIQEHIDPDIFTILNKHKLDRFAKKHWTQLSQSRLSDKDITIAMDRFVVRDFWKGLVIPNDIIIWDIADISATLNLSQNHKKKMAFFETTLRKIKKRVDQLLVKELQLTTRK